MRNVLTIKYKLNMNKNNYNCYNWDTVIQFGTSGAPLKVSYKENKSNPTPDTIGDIITPWQNLRDDVTGYYDIAGAFDFIPSLQDITLTTRRKYVVEWLNKNEVFIQKTRFYLSRLMSERTGREFSKCLEMIQLLNQEGREILSDLAYNGPGCIQVHPMIFYKFLADHTAEFETILFYQLINERR